MPTTVRLLGPPGVLWEGAWTEPPLSKASALLYRLAHEGGWLSRDEVLALLWPDSDETRARSNLRKLLSRDLKRLPFAADVEIQGERLRWAVDSDLSAFRAALEARSWTAAARRYGGPLLDGVRPNGLPEFEDWLELERQSLHETWRGALLQGVSELLADRCFAEGAELLERLHAADPLDEEVLRRLLDALARAGERERALGLFERFRHALEHEFGGDPDADTLALIADLPGAEVAAAPTPPPTASASIPDFESVADEEPLFVARSGELADLHRALGEAIAGRAGVRFVTGEAGRGKTSLLQAFAREAQARRADLVVAVGNGNAYTGIGDPFLPFREILELLTGDVEARAATGALYRDSARRLWDFTPTTARALVEHGPDLLDTLLPAEALLRRVGAHDVGNPLWWSRLQGLVRSDRGRGEGAGVQQTALLEQGAKVLDAVAREAPLLLLLDDLQWIDGGSANLLLHLGRRLRTAPVLIVGAYRPDDVALGRDGERHPLERIVNELRRDRGEVTYDLGRSEGRALVDALVDTEPNALDADFRDTLYRQTGGHPLFVVELMRTMQERGDLVRDDVGRWRAERLDWSALPARVEGAIAERIARLDPELRELLQVASLEGEEFTAEVVAEVLGRDPLEVTRSLSQQLDRAHRLVRSLGVRREGSLRLARYRFRHILIQAYLYRTLDEVERPYRHEALGLAMEALFAERLDQVAVQLARHFELAMVPEKSAVYLALAGDQARRAVALDDAVRSYRAALELWPDGEEAGRARVLSDLGETLWVLGRIEEALGVFERAFALFEALGDVRRAGNTQRNIGRMYWEQNDRERSMAHYRRALEILEDAPGSVELAWAYSSMSQMAMLADDYEEALAWGERALALADELDAEPVRIHANTNIGAVYYKTGLDERARPLLEATVASARELRMPHDALRAQAMIRNLLSGTGQTDEAIAEGYDILAYAEQHHVPLFIGGTLFSLIGMTLWTGRWREARTLFERQLGWDGPDIGYLRVFFAIYAARAYNVWGLPDRAVAQLDAVADEVAQRAEPQTTYPFLEQRYASAQALGRSDVIDATIERALDEIDMKRDGWAPRHLTLLASRWLLEHDRSESYARADELLASLDADSLQDRFDRVDLLELRGLAALRRGDLERARALLRDAWAHWRSLPFPLSTLRAARSLTDALDPDADRDEAVETLARADAIVADLAEQLDGSAFHDSFLTHPLIGELDRRREALAGGGPR